MADVFLSYARPNAAVAGRVEREPRLCEALGAYTPRNDRQTTFLFNPAIAPLRVDPRFSELMKRLRLTDYWRQSGVKPDYLTGRA